LVIAVSVRSLLVIALRVRSPLVDQQCAYGIGDQVEVGVPGAIRSVR
jgi:hypothetical protein